ncbi:MAG: hypothetical protein ABIQ01_03285 [Pseudolysinimonas sp.]
MSGFVGAVTVLLLLGGPSAAPPERSWVPGEHSGTSIHLSVENWGEDVDLSTPGLAVWAHLGANGPTTHVTVRIEPGENGLHGYYGRLTAPDAFGGPKVLYCGDEYHQIESSVICGFDVPMARGLNHLEFDLQSASFDGIQTQLGMVIGATLQMVPVLEARQADGSWGTVPSGGGLELPGTQTSALRYRIMNTGDIPFRAPSACQEGGTVWPYQQLLCTLRSPRPVFALAGDYEVPIRLVDPVGGGASFLLTGSVVVPGVSIPRTQHP